MYWKLQECKAGSSERGFAWRTAELYLNSAEAYAEKFAAGDAASGAKAVNEINALRKSVLQQPLIRIIPWEVQKN